MEMAQEWFSELESEGQMFMIDDEVQNLYDNISFVDSFSSESYAENMKLVIDQSILETQQQENKRPPHYQEPIVSTTRPSSNTFTISFGNINPKKEKIPLPDSPTRKVPTAGRNNNQAQDHVLSERKRREKLNQHIISLSSLLPNLKKMDKASVLEDASNYIKELQDRIKELEGLSSTKRKNVQECVISIKRSRIINSDDEYSSSDETNSRDQSSAPCIASPEIQVRISGSSVLVRVHCGKNITSLVNILNQMQKLGLSIISSSTMPFANTTILITIVAQIEDDQLCMTTQQLVKNIQLAL